MTSWTRLVLYKPELLYLELQQFHQDFVCWFSGPYNTRKVKFLNQFWLENCGGNLRFKQSLAMLSSNFYQIKPSIKLQIARNQINLARAHFEQCMVGAMVGFKNALRVRGVGYRFDISSLKVIVHAGYSHRLIHKLSRRTLFESLVMNKKFTVLRVKSSNLSSLSNFVSTIRNLRSPDVYKGKGIRYQKEFIIRKEGKKKKAT